MYPYRQIYQPFNSVFFSHNKSAYNTFCHDLPVKRTRPFHNFLMMPGYAAMILATSKRTQGYTLLVHKA